MSSAHQSGFQPGWIHYTIFGLSAALLGIYSVQVLPFTVAQTILQSGIIGLITVLGFVHAALKCRSHIRESQTEDRVQARLDRQLDGVDSRRDHVEIAATGSEETVAESVSDETVEATAIPVPV